MFLFAIMKTSMILTQIFSSFHKLAYRGGTGAVQEMEGIRVRLTPRFLFSHELLPS